MEGRRFEFWTKGLVSKDGFLVTCFVSSVSEVPITTLEFELEKLDKNETNTD